MLGRCQDSFLRQVVQMCIHGIHSLNGDFHTSLVLRYLSDLSRIPEMVLVIVSVVNLNLSLQDIDTDKIHPA